MLFRSVGLRPDTEWLHGFKVGEAAADMRLVERMRLIASNQLEIVNTYDSKIAMTAPYTFKITRTRVPQPMQEDICAQNNRDINGKGGQMFDTTPPPLR